MTNASELDTLRQLLTSNTISTIKLTGYASPEGPYPFNEKLAAHRAAAVKDYMTKNNMGNPTSITAESAPIDWSGLKDMLNDSKISNYLKIISIIDNNTIKPADKNNAIRSQYPVEYKFMFRTWYPKLRKTEIAISHQPQKMDLQSAKQQIKIDPSKLSLGDIYMVALSYEKGSKEWDEIILLAVQTYPNVAEARINAANVAMANGNYAQAAAYLQGLPENMPEAMNSRGILAMSEGKYQQALSLFEAAQKAGVSEATYNISLVKQLMSLES
jgi:tetratricopeptide (TPR) repeat protein